MIRVRDGVAVSNSYDRVEVRAIIRVSYIM